MSPARPKLGEGWTVWRHAILRGAGFPFSLLDQVFRAPDIPAAVRNMAADPRFREAVMWQNRPVLETALDPLVKHPAAAPNAKLRQRQLLVAKYLQRYCAKNDTIGFFGPVGWASLGSAAHLKPGPSLIARRATFFEPWAVLAMAEASRSLASDKAPVWLPGHLRLERRSLQGPVYRVQLTTAEWKVIRAAKGQPAKRLLAEIDGSARPSQTRATLEQLVGGGMLRQGFPVSIALEPEKRWLQLAGRSPGLSSLLAKRKKVAAAAGNPEALVRALTNLEGDFVRRTGQPAWRSAGQMHSGRGLVYEECQRALSLDLGNQVIQKISTELRIVLEIARWYTFQIAVRFAVALRQMHVAEGSARVPLHRFWKLADPLFEHSVPPIVHTVATEMQRRWEELWSHCLSCTDGDHLDVTQAEHGVLRKFAAPCPGWPGARHHSPDLMWAASSADDLFTGRATPILSELHPGVTPFSTLSVLSLCPVTDELKREWSQDFPSREVSAVPNEVFARSTHDARLASEHWHLDLGGEYVSDREPSQVLRAADYDVVSRRGILTAIPRGGRGPRFDLLRVLESRIKLRAAAAFSLSRGVATGVRRYLGNLMVQRRQWNVASLEFLAPTEYPFERVQTWRRSLGLPDRIFVRSPLEVKPIYVDLQSHISVEMFARFARPAPSLCIAEMFPAADGLWLTDHAGNRYVSELRFIAVDPKRFRSQSVWLATPASARELAPKEPAGGYA